MIAPRVVPRAVPLPPTAALGLGATARELLLALARLPDARLSRLRGVWSDDLVLVTGAGDDLPWCDGVRYLGKDAAAPSLLVPTVLALDVHPALVERAIARHVGEPSATVAPPWALCFEPLLVIPAGRALALSRDAIEARLAPHDEARP
jgi:hypothetical protein